LFARRIQKVFGAGTGVERVYFPKKSNEVPDRPVLTLAVLAPENAAPEPATKSLNHVDETESGSSSQLSRARSFGFAPEDSTPLHEEARSSLRGGTSMAMLQS